VGVAVGGALTVTGLSLTFLLADDAKREEAATLRCGFGPAMVRCDGSF
jgi:hypothetical protein